MDDAYEWVSVEEAGRRLNASASTIRRMIREGALVGELQARSERDRRKQFVVRFNRHQTAPEAASEAPEGTTTPQAASEAVTLALVAEIAAARESHAAERAADQQTIRDQAEEIGSLKAQLAAERAAREKAERRWWRWW